MSLLSVFGDFSVSFWSLLSTIIDEETLDLFNRSSTIYSKEVETPPPEPTKAELESIEVEG